MLRPLHPLHPMPFNLVSGIGLVSLMMKRTCLTTRKSQCHVVFRTPVGAAPSAGWHSWTSGARLCVTLATRGMIRPGEKRKPSPSLFSCTQGSPPRTLRGGPPRVVPRCAFRSRIQVRTTTGPPGALLPKEVKCARARLPKRRLCCRMRWAAA